MHKGCNSGDCYTYKQARKFVPLLVLDGGSRKTLSFKYTYEFMSYPDMFTCLYLILYDRLVFNIIRRRRVFIFSRATPRFYDSQPMCINNIISSYNNDIVIIIVVQYWEREKEGNRLRALLKTVFRYTSTQHDAIKLIFLFKSNS